MLHHRLHDTGMAVMGFMVGATPPRYLAGVVTSIASGIATVRVSDSEDIDGQPVEIIATGTAAINDKITVMINGDGRAVIIGR